MIWANTKTYLRTACLADLGASAAMVLLIIPQALAYSILAGLPPVLGLYACLLPPILYALLGTSKTLSVGPMAIISLLTASAIGTVSATGLASPVAAAITLSFLCGSLLVLFSLLRLGYLTNFLAHGVVTGFITASALLIALSQIQPLLNLPAAPASDTLLALLTHLVAHADQAHLLTLSLGLPVLAWLWLSQYVFPVWLKRLAPLAAVLITTVIAANQQMDQQGLAVVGAVPQGLPRLSGPDFNWPLIKALLLPALMIALMVFIESFSIAQSMAAKRRQVINPNRELLALGGANIGSGLIGAFPVCGSFARSALNASSGAKTQMAGVFAALGVAIVIISFSPWLFFLPKTTLAALVIVAVLSLINVHELSAVWRFSRPDFWSISITLVATLALGVELGLLTGVLASFVLFVHRSAHPHIAVIGRIPDTEHFRNQQRHQVETIPGVCFLRADESLFFANSRELEQAIYQQLTDQPNLTDLVLVCSAINSIDYSALEMLERVNENLAAQKVALHLCEVKGPVMDKLKSTHLINQLHSRVYLSTNDAFASLEAKLQP